MPGMTLKIPKDSPAHARIKQELETRIRMAEKSHQDRHAYWQRSEEVVNAYVPESADDARRRADRDATGNPHYTTIQIPYSYALLMAAHTYWTSVFFARSPVHQFSGRHGESEQAVQALEATIAYQTQVGGMMAPYYLWAYDAGKYGTGILGTYWDKEEHQYSILTENEKGEQVYVTNRVPGYQGNKVYNVAPYNFLPDPRLPVGQFQKGEFVAVYREMSWNELIRRTAQNYYVKENVDKIKSTSGRKNNWSSAVSGLPTISDELGHDNNKHPAWVGIYEVYVELIPSEWKLGAMEMPEKWVFTITADFATIIGAQPLGLVHNRYPFDVFEPEPEAYSLWNRGIPEVVKPLQDTMDWLINSHFYNVRAIGNGRFIADPSKIDLSQLEKGDAGWIAALRPEAWGTVTDVRQVFQQIQTSDPTAMHMADFERMFSIGERVTGINEQILGALSGGRKTATEVRTSTGFGVNRLKTASEYMSAVGMSAHAQKLVQNTQQMLEEPINVRLVGDLVRFGGTKYTKVDPEAIAGFYDFVPVDGTLPVDRYAQATLWKDIMGQLRNVPEVAMEYDLSKIFAWVAGLAGIKNMEQMRRAAPMNVQVAPDDVLQRQADAGNLIPFKGSAGAGPQTSLPTASMGG